MSYCDNCYKDCKTFHKCKICGTETCNNCNHEANVVFFNEWLRGLSNRCSECKRIGCNQCMQTCFDCHNEGEFAPMFCEKCSPLKKINCKYHTWYTCNKHKKKCGECKANENYHFKHS